MARRISVKDSKTIYYAYRIGKNARNINVYGDILETKAYISDKSGESIFGHFGTENKYDISVILEQNDSTKYIDRYTKLWIETKPLDSSKEEDYEIVQNPICRNGLIYFECNSKPRNNADIYYLLNNQILKTNVILDMGNGIFYISSNTYCPITEDTKVWYMEPENAQDNDYVLEINSIEENNGITYYSFVYEEEN